jgi:hypothetical protein
MQGMIGYVVPFWLCSIVLRLKLRYSLLAVSGNLSLKLRSLDEFSNTEQPTKLVEKILIRLKVDRLLPLNSMQEASRLHAVNNVSKGKKRNSKTYELRFLLLYVNLCSLADHLVFFFPIYWVINTGFPPDNAFDISLSETVSYVFISHGCGENGAVNRRRTNRQNERCCWLRYRWQNGRENPVCEFRQSRQ